MFSKPNFILPLLFLGAASHTSLVLAQSPGTFIATGDMTTARSGHTATLLPSGKVLIAGGFVGGGFVGVGTLTASAELYDPASSKFAAVGNMLTARHSHTATLLPDGTVLIAGGNSTWPNPTATAEIYHPAVLEIDLRRPRGQ